MAPEVGLGLPYNESCDIYSFAIVLWEMLTLQSPYGKKISVARLMKQVWQKGQRPMMKFPLEMIVMSTKRNYKIIDLLKCCWSVDIDKRYDMAKVHQILKQEFPEEIFQRSKEAQKRHFSI